MADETVRTQLETLSDIGGELGRPEIALIAAILHQGILDAQNGSLSALRFLKSNRARAWALIVGDECLRRLDAYIDNLQENGYSL